MKIKNFTCSAFLVLATSFLALPVVASEGGTSGGGGDGCVAEFKSIGDSLVQMLKSHRGIFFPIWSAPNSFKFFDENTGFMAMVKTARVECRDRAYLPNWQERDAVNYPKKKLILVGRIRWTQMALEAKQTLVFHEYLSLAGLESDGDYHISSELQTNLHKDFWECYANCGFFSRFPMKSEDPAFKVDLGAAGYLYTKPVLIYGETPERAIVRGGLQFGGNPENHCYGDDWYLAGNEKVPTFFYTSIGKNDRGMWLAIDDTATLIRNGACRLYKTGL